MAVIPGGWYAEGPNRFGRWWVMSRDGGDEYAVAKCYGDGDGDEASTAKLVAAAPEMLAALCEARDALAALGWEGDENWRHWDATRVDSLIAGTLHVVNQVIAKADGLTKEGSDGEDRRMD